MNVHKLGQEILHCIQVSPAEKHQILQRTVHVVISPLITTANYSTIN